MRKDADSSRLNNFDFIRFCLAVTVIFSHSYPIGQGDQSHDPFEKALGVSAGHLAVACFFSISGYLIIASWSRKKSIGDYFYKRVARIYPGWLAVNLITIGVLASFYMITLSDVVAWIPEVPLLGYFSVPNAFSGNNYPGVINGSLWTIPYEFQCYIAVAVLGILGLAGSYRLLCATLMVLVISWSNSTFHWLPNSSVTSFFSLASFFFVGACLFEFRDRVEYSFRMASAVLIVGGVAFCFPILRHAVPPIAITYLILYAAFQQHVKLHSFGKYGDFSYGIYLYAFPIQQCIVWAGGGAMNPILLFLLATPPSIVAGIASWYGIERRCLPKKRQRETPNIEEAVRPVETGVEDATVEFVES
ncbi:acyltransferase family protein [Blastopirellula marina]|uniref:Acyltransferase 3 domain-containing protein n=1 Tax=Blastopirellula marina TaxID=124 RepID=A0A2S8GLG3_9BACT|nr:acyltransferase [Blastopirellula marina]PQO45275.1 hypothetical protein C5Y93_15070 [Blastopirellula marina]